MLYQMSYRAKTGLILQHANYRTAQPVLNWHARREPNPQSMVLETIALPFGQLALIWCIEQDLNLLRSAFQTDALPDELPMQIINLAFMTGIEPAGSALKGR